MSTAERVRPAPSRPGREPGREAGREPGRLTRLDAAIGVVGEVLVTLGVLVLAFLAWQLWWTDVIADGEQAQTVSGLEQRFAASTASTAPAVTAQVGQAFATIRIPGSGPTTCVRSSRARPRRRSTPESGTHRARPCRAGSATSRPPGTG